MVCRLVALDKRPGVYPVVIVETLWRALAKFVLRASGDQAKVVYGNLQLCAGIQAGIDGSMHNVHRRREVRGASRGGRLQEIVREGA